jgi:hypothetical protein
VTATPTPTSAPKRETSTKWASKDAAKTAAVTGGLLYRDSFTSDATGTVPAGWSVTGANAGFSVAASDSSYGNVYAHDGWTSTTSAGSTAWTNYTLSVAVQPSAWQSEQDCIDVRYVDAADHDAVCFEGGGSIVLLRVAGGSSVDLARVSLAYTSSWYQLSIAAFGSTFTVQLDGQTLMTVSDSAFCHGAIGFDANAPVEFGNVTVTAS